MLFQKRKLNNFISLIKNEKLKNNLEKFINVKKYLKRITYDLNCYHYMDYSFDCINPGASIAFYDSFLLIRSLYIFSYTSRNEKIIYTEFHENYIDRHEEIISGLTENEQIIKNIIT